MEFYIVIPNLWIWFCLSLALALITSLAMSLLAANFLTKDGSTRKFSIMDLEFPSSGLDLVNNINGIYRLPADKINKIIRSLKNSLYLDFIFMPAIYGCIFLLCMEVSSKFVWKGHPAFAFFAWLQLLAWLFDIIENIYLLQKIKPKSEPSGQWVHRLYHYMVLAKWAIALLGGVCSIMVLLYFWLTGNFYRQSLIFSVIVIAEIVLFFVLGYFLKKRMTNS